MEMPTKDQIEILLGIIGNGRRALERGSVKAKDAQDVAQFWMWLGGLEKSLQEQKASKRMEPVNPEVSVQMGV